MKILELLESVFVEAATADLYHGTSLRGALNILRDNVIKANMPIHSTKVPDTVKGHNRTVSLTRSIDVAMRFADDKRSNWADAASVVFVIDQDRLKQSLGRRVRPYDDTSTDWFRKQIGVDHDQSLRTTYRNEIEEVVYGDIANANQYIKKIIVVQPSRDDSGTSMLAIEKSGILDHPKAILLPHNSTPGSWRKLATSRGMLGSLGIKPHY